MEVIIHPSGFIQAARKRKKERFDRRYVWSKLKEFYHKALVEE